MRSKKSYLLILAELVPCQWVSVEKRCGTWRDGASSSGLQEGNENPAGNKGLLYYTLPSLLTVVKTEVVKEAKS